jgi:hypothetical protein
MGKALKKVGPDGQPGDNTPLLVELKKIDRQKVQVIPDLISQLSARYFLSTFLKFSLIYSRNTKR